MTPLEAEAATAFELGADTKAVLLAAGLIFLLALVLGVWKYRQMSTSPDGLAHPYVDTAHRAALLYSFATLLIATFVELSGWSETVDSIAAFVVIFYFLAAVGSYIWHGAQARHRQPDPRPGARHRDLLLVARGRRDRRLLGAAGGLRRGPDSLGGRGR